MIHLLIEAFSAILFLIPVFLYLNWIRFRNIQRTALYFLFALYLAALYQIVGLPTVQFLTFDVQLNLIPLLPMAQDLRNSILNILLFVPLGFFLPLLWKKYRRMQATLLFGLSVTSAVELLQLLTYRVTDINDILANCLGTYIGWLGFLPIQKAARGRIRGLQQTGDLFLILLLVLIIMFFAQPTMASLLYKIL